MIPDPPPKPVAYIVPKSAYFTGMTAQEASARPDVVIIHESDLSAHELAAHKMRGYVEPLVVLGREREVREVHVLTYPRGGPFILPPRRQQPKPELSRRDLNPRKGRR